MKARKRLAAVLTLGLLGAMLLGPEAAQAAPRCFGRMPTIVGTSGNDRLRGTPGPDVIVGLGGRDELLGRGGIDRLCTGPGHDGAAGQAGNDLLNGARGSDFLAGGQGNDVIKGSAQNDFLIGQAGSDRLLGGTSRGLEFLAPGPGNDSVGGGGGLLDVATFFDAQNGVSVNLSLTTPQATGQGVDRLRTVEGLEGSENDDTLTGNGLQSASGNGFFGLSGADTISGLSGIDSMFGEQGNDDLFGGEHDDFLDGGRGAGDFGDGGETGESPEGDTCVNIEVEAPGTCEQTSAAASAHRSSRAWLGGVGAGARDMAWLQHLL
jgi:Ca2+-binding RTX toxin-like protein